VLDGDRDELRAIRNELTLLRLSSHPSHPSPPYPNHSKSPNPARPNPNRPSFYEIHHNPPPGAGEEERKGLQSHSSSSEIANIRKELRALLESGLYEGDGAEDDLIVELKKNLAEAEKRSGT